MYKNLFKIIFFSFFIKISQKQIKNKIKTEDKKRKEKTRIIIEALLFDKCACVMYNCIVNTELLYKRGYKNEKNLPTEKKTKKQSARIQKKNELYKR